MKELLKKYYQGDKYMWTFIWFLVVASLVSVYSASTALAYIRHNGDITGTIMRHVVCLLLGVLSILVCSNIRPKVFYTFADIGVLMGLLSVVLVLFVGSQTNGSARWFKLGGGITIQPSEFAKIALVIYVAKQLAINFDDPNKSLRKIFLWSAGIVGFIAAENLSTALLIVFTIGFMLFIGHVSLKWLGIISSAAVGLLVLILIFAPLLKNTPLSRANTWVARIERFCNDDDENDDKNSQAIQSKMAVATGGLVGVGAGNSKMKNFLPMAFSDFIFAIILEEYGIWGGALVILAYIGLLSRAIVISKSCVKVFHIYTLLGLVIMITLQAAINMCVAVGILPVTGQTLPMISMGGSSSMFIGCALGLMLSISAEVKREVVSVEAKPVASTPTTKEDYDDDTTDFDAEAK